VRTIIAGSRDLNSYTLVVKAVEESGILPTVVLSGGARGIDRQGEKWASQRGIPVEYYPAMWRLWGNSAGFRRNVEMAANADALIAVWDGSSRGTKHMIETALSKGLTVYVHDVAAARAAPEGTGGNEP
jgi:hypothetical protein